MLPLITLQQIEIVACGGGLSFDLLNLPIALIEHAGNILVPGSASKAEHMVRRVYALVNTFIAGW